MTTATLALTFPRLARSDHDTTDVRRGPIPCANYCGETSETTPLHGRTGLCARCLVERMQRTLIRLSCLAVKQVPELESDCTLLEELLQIEAGRAHFGHASASLMARRW